MALSSKIGYEIKESVFVIHRLGSSEILPIASIRDVTLKLSRIFKNRGTVKIKTDEKNYYFRLVKDADEPYGIILESMQKAEQ